MYNDAFFHKLAIERCQHNLAQLCAALFTGMNCDRNGVGGQTVQALIEILNKDLHILECNLKVAANEGIPGDQAPSSVQDV